MLLYGNSENSPIPIQPPTRIFQYNFSVERQLGGGAVLDVTYAGGRGTNLPILTQNVDTLPDADLAQGSTLIQSVANPFYGLAAAGATLGSEQTVTNAQLQLPYPQFTGIGAINRQDRNSYYNSLQVKIEKRFSHGGTVLAAYTWSKLDQEIAPDFTLEDVWALPAYGGAGDFPALLEVMTSRDQAREASPVTRLLFGARVLLGRWFGWDGGAARPIPGRNEVSLAERLPDDLHGTAASLRLGSSFSPLYRTGTEFAAELSNQTVHGVLHLAWVDRGHGATRDRWPSTPSRAAGSGNSTWRSSRHSGTGWSTRPCCARSNGRGRHAS